MSGIDPGLGNIDSSSGIGVGESSPIYQIGWLLNGASPNLNVDGSAVNVNFSFAPAAATVFFVESLTVYIEDVGTPDQIDFGNLATLANGLLIRNQINAVTYDINTIVDNMGLTTTFSNYGLIPSNAAGAGFLNHNDIFVGMLEFKNPIPLNGTNGDFIRVIVRDNLTAIDFLRIKYKAYRVV